MRRLFRYYALLALLSLSYSAHAENNEAYYQALSLLSEKKWDEAEDTLQNWVSHFNTVNHDQFKAQAVLALIQAKNQGSDLDIEETLVPVLCKGLSESQQSKLELNCFDASSQPALNSLETQLLATTLMAYGTLAWKQSNYVSAVNAYASATHFMTESEHGNDASSENSSLRTSNQAIQAGMDTEQLMKAMQANMLKKALQGNLTKETAESMIDQEALQAIAMKQAKGHPIGKQEKKIAKAASRELKILSRLGKDAMCPKQAFSADSASNYEQGVAASQQALAEGFELMRGKKTDDFAIVQSEVIEAVNDYADALIEVQSKLGTSLLSRVSERLTNGGRSDWFKAASSCHKQLNIPQHTRNAALIELNRRNRNIEYINQTTNLLAKLDRLDKKPGSMDSISERMMQNSLSAAYIAAGQCEKALTHAELALNNLPTTPMQASSQLTQLSQMASLGSLSLYSECLPASGSKKTMTQFDNLFQLVKNYVGVTPEKTKQLLELNTDDILALQTRQMNMASKNITSNVKNFMTSAQSDVATMIPGADEKFSVTLKAFENLPSAADMMAAMEKMQNGESAQLNLPDEQAHILQKIAENTPTFSSDIMGVSIQIWRDQINQSRVNELLLAKSLVVSGNFEQAEELINRANKSDLDAPFYRPYVRSLDNYLRATLAEKKGHDKQASDLYRLSIIDWYFNPTPKEILVFSVYNGPTWLLEQAINFELKRKNLEAAFNYTELARVVRLDNPELFGYMTSERLQSYQNHIENEYHKLIKEAEVTAAKAQQSHEFKAQFQLADTAVKRSVRKIESPVLPLLNGINGVYRWLDRDSVQRWLAHLERFTAIYEKSAIDQYRWQQQTASRNTTKTTTDKVLTQLAWLDKGGPLDDGFTSSAYRPLTWVRKNISDSDTVFTALVLPGVIHSFSLTTQTLEYKSLTPNTLPLADTFIKAPGVTTGKALYDAFLASHKPQFKNNVIALTNGPLQNIPLAAIWDGNSYMLDKYTIRYAPSIGLIRGHKLANTKMRTPMVIAEAANTGSRPLTSIEQEINGIQQYYKSTILQGQALTKASLFNTLEDAQLLHFAGHSELNKDFPDRSSIILDKERIYLKDISQLNLPNLELVVLSSCSSGASSSLILSNEFSSLNAAFMQAGAESVIASLHPVSDAATSELMQQFYRALAKGSRKDEALKTAQLALKEKYPEDSQQWAAFVLSGDPSPVSSSL